MIICNLWFSVLFTKLIEVAVFSPPIGINIFATLSAARHEGNLSSLCRGVAPFMLAETINIGLLLVFPALSTWLPEKMLGL